MAFRVRPGVAVKGGGSPALNVGAVDRTMGLDDILAALETFADGGAAGFASGNRTHILVIGMIAADGCGVLSGSSSGIVDAQRVDRPESFFEGRRVNGARDPDGQQKDGGQGNRDLHSAGSIRRTAPSLASVSRYKNPSGPWRTSRMRWRNSRSSA